MNLQQLEYIIAVDSYRHFVTASEKCFVTQPTLSMMIRKLEEELDTIIFDRSKQPVVPTIAGKQIIEQAKLVVNEAKKIPLLCQEMKGQLKGELQIGIIPTVAPYLLPLFFDVFRKKYPAIKLIFSEITTGEIINRLKDNQLDCGILATPLNHQQIIEKPMYYEEFMLYASSSHPILNKELIDTDMLDYENLWLLHESHCLRSQIINFCDIRNRGEKAIFNYEVGSIETLKKLVDLNNGLTILPELAINEFDDQTRQRVRRFVSPNPIREISMVTYKYTLKTRMLELLFNTIREAVPSKMLSRMDGLVAPVIS